MAKLLITGAAGNVATLLRPQFEAADPDLAWSDRVRPDWADDATDFRHADLTNPDEIKRALEGVTKIIHLGGQATEADWETVRLANIEGLQNLLEMAKGTGVKRFVFASSVHAVGFYPRARRISIQDPTRPDGFYGASKAFGESLCALYADKHGLRCLSIRIGNVNPAPIDKRRLSIWIHPEDLFQLCRIGLDHPDIHNQIVFGMSDNKRAWWDNSVAAGLGYRPRHRSEDYAESVLARPEQPDRISDRFQGGTFCADGFTGDLQRTESA